MKENLHVRFIADVADGWFLSWAMSLLIFILFNNLSHFPFAIYVNFY
jgi:hypothetical protein